MKHTPAPWTVGTPNLYTKLNIGIWGDDYVICDMCEDGHSVAEQVANARLIASAPELLEALKDLLRDLDTVDSYALNETVLPIWEDIARAKAIIAKAEGAP
jgi:hypothetical protein